MKDPYLYDDCNILINKANIKTQQKLDDFESTMVNLGIIKLLKDSISFKYSNKTMDSKYKTIKEYNLEKYKYNSHKYKEN